MPRSLPARHQHGAMCPTAVELCVPTQLSTLHLPYAVTLSIDVWLTRIPLCGVTSLEFKFCFRHFYLCSSLCLSLPTCKDTEVKTLSFNQHLSSPLTPVYSTTKIYLECMCCFSSPPCSSFSLQFLSCLDYCNTLLPGMPILTLATIWCLIHISARETI